MIGVSLNASLCQFCENEYCKKLFKSYVWKYRVQTW